MLRSLRIRDYALIDDLSIEWSPGLNVLTGETGAGKSIILGALSLVLGEKADPDSIRTGKDSTSVEAVFDPTRQTWEAVTELALEGDDEKQLAIRRKVAREGKSGIFVNDHSATSATLKRLGDSLVDLHGQHEHQSLLRRELHLGVLDDFAKLTASAGKLAESYAEYRRIESELNVLLAELADKRNRRDLTLAQQQELQQANLVADEIDALNREQQLLGSSEQRHTLAYEITNVLSESESSVLELLAGCARRLDSLAELDPKLAARNVDLKQAMSVLDELWRALVSYQESTEFSPGRLEEVNERLFLLQKLIRKHCAPSAGIDSAAMQELIALREQLTRELNSLELDETRTQELQKRLSTLRKNLVKEAEKLSQARLKAKERLEQKLNKEFLELGMPKARIEAQIARVEQSDGLYEDHGTRFRLDARGIDDVEFLFSANPGEDLKPLRKIASGGELSRIMLALKSVLSDSDPVPVLVFDEIDTGISGRIAEAVGGKLSRLARDKQVICITHLPQIARFASAHFRVSKETKAGRTQTRIALLNESDRVEELASLLAGKEVTATARAHARELLSKGRRE
jgi:DNA repair protein RecN (Recombination protein N)